jgi:hypothetical protein
MASEDGFVFLPDEPIESVEQDQFQHSEYVDSLEEILRHASPPWNIGVFGKWGTGKTSIIKLLFDRLKKQSEGDVLCVEFDAWKHAEGPIRTDLLLGLDRAIGEETGNKVEGEYGVLGEDTITRVLYDIDAETDEADLSAWDEAIKFFSQSKLIGGVTAVLFIALTGGALFNLLSIVGIWNPGQATLSSVNSILNAFLIPLFLALFVFMAGQVREATSTLRHKSPRKEWPGAYENLFDEIIDKTDKDTIIISVDNLDRCESETVYDVLVSLKTFMEHDRCIYLIPCDDQALLSHIQSIDEGGYFENAENEREFLRKFFQAHVRIPPFIREDIEEYAASLNQELKDPYEPDVLDVITKAYIKNPRRIKQAFNHVTTLRLIAEEIEDTTSLREEKITTNLSFLAKIAILQEDFPRFYAALQRNPHLLDEMNDYFAGRITDEEREQEVTSHLRTENGEGNEIAGLEEFLWSTRWVVVDNPRPFLHLSEPSYTTQLADPEGFVQNLRTGQIEDVRKELEAVFSNGESFDPYFDAIESTLEEWRHRESALFSTIDGLMSVYDIMNQETKTRVAQMVSDYLVSNRGKAILGELDPDTAFPMIIDMNASDTRELLEVYAEQAANTEHVQQSILDAFVANAEDVPQSAVHQLSDSLIALRHNQKQEEFTDVLGKLAPDASAKENLVTTQLLEEAVELVEYDTNSNAFTEAEWYTQFDDVASRTSRSTFIAHLFNLGEEYSGGQEDQFEQQLIQQLLEIEGPIRQSTANQVFRGMRDHINSQGGQPGDPIEVCLRFYNSFDSSTKNEFHSWITNLLRQWNQNGVQQIVQNAEQYDVNVFESAEAIDNVLDRVPGIVGNQTFFINTLMPAIPEEYTEQIEAMAERLAESNDHDDTSILAEIFAEHPDRFTDSRSAALDCFRNHYKRTNNVSQRKAYLSAEAAAYTSLNEKEREQFVGRLTSLLTGNANEHQAFREVWLSVADEVGPERRETVMRDIENQIEQELQGNLQQNALEPLLDIFHSLEKSGDVPPQTGSKIVERITARWSDENLGHNPKSALITILASFTNFYGEESRTLTRLEALLDQSNHNSTQNHAKKLLNTLNKHGEVSDEKIQAVEQLL